MKKRKYSRHHYVPKGYLKLFTFIHKKKDGEEQRLYKFERINIEYPTPIKFDSFSPKQICYYHDLYKIDDEDLLNMLGIDDVNYAELNAFKEYENTIGSIIKGLTTRRLFERKYITFKEAEIFIRALLNIKKRNPYLLNYPDTKLGIERKAKATIEQIKAIAGYENDVKMMASLEFLNKALSDPDYSKKVGVYSLIQDSLGKSGVIAYIAEALLSNIWYIYESSINDIFITSDNPGFSVNYKDVMDNLNFKEESRFIFPLTPHHILVIHNATMDNLVQPFKEIVFKKCPSGLVTSMNRSTLRNSDIIFSNSQNALISTIEDYKKYYLIETIKK